MKNNLRKVIPAFCLLILCLLLTAEVFAEGGVNVGEGLPINETVFPDAVFRNYLASHCDTDQNGTFSDYELFAVKYIDCSGSGVDSDKIVSLEGIEHFTFLEKLDCGNNLLTSLDLSNNLTLQELYCSGNSELTSLNVSGCSALTVVYSNDCPLLENLNISGCEELNTLECCNCYLSEINLNNCQSLCNLTCYGNRIGAIDIMPCYTLSTIVENYEPVIDNGIAFYNYEDHNISFDADVILVNFEPDFVLPASLTTIDEEAFMGCAFRYVVLPDQIECIGKNAFAYCSNLLCIRISNSVSQIDDQAFGNLTGIVIYGTSGSIAETFAEAHGCFFIPVDRE